MIESLTAEIPFDLEKRKRLSVKFHLFNKVENIY